MSKQTTQNKSESKNNNITLKLCDVDETQIVVDKVKIKENYHLLVRYGPEKKTLNFQPSKTKQRQFPIQPGQVLPNGKKNEYYVDEEARLSAKFCIDPRCAVNTNPEDPDETNEAEITADVEKLKKIDARIKNELYKMCGIDDDDKEKYVPIHRKPVKSKKPTANDREKYFTVKAKFDWKNGVEDPTSSILTEFYSVDSETKNWKTAKLLNNTNGHISLTEIEKELTLNVEVQPVLQCVKVWTQSTGAWGITLKLKMLRLMKTEYTQRGNASFLNSDDEDEPVAAPVVKKQVATVVDESDSDEESDDEVTSAPVKAAPVQTTTKKVAVVESDSDEESDEDVKPVKKAPAKAPAKSKKASA